MSAPAVFITVPKYVAITPNLNGTTTTTTTLPRIRPAPIFAANNGATLSPAMSPISSGYASSTGSVSEGCVNAGADGCASKGKKRRLDHLTWEEKVQRKKLKNRVAAQTSRDRKKARMEEMDHEISELTQTTEILQNKCESLQAINDSLLEKNRKLDMEVELLRQQLNEIQQQQQKQAQQSAINNNNINSNNNVVATCAGCESILNGSAVSNTDPLQQGSPQMDSQSTQEQQQQLKKSNTLWRIIVLCLLYKTCSLSTKSSMQESWKNLPKVYSQISQQTWRQLIERAMKLLPKLTAEQSDCLDQWWGPQQNAWNPADIAPAPQLLHQQQEVAAA